MHYFFFGSWIGASEFFPPFIMVLLIGELFSTGSRGMFLLAVKFCIVLLDHEKSKENAKWYKIFKDGSQDRLNASSASLCAILQLLTTIDKVENVSCFARELGLNFVELLLLL